MITAATARNVEEIAAPAATGRHADLDALAAADRAKARPVPVSPSIDGLSLQSALDHLDASISALSLIRHRRTLFPVALSNSVAVEEALLDARHVLSAVVYAEQPSAFPNDRP